MPTLDTEEGTKNGRKGTIYRVGLKIKTEGIAGVREAEQAAERRARTYLGARLRTIPTDEYEFMEAQEKFTDPFAMRAEWEVKFFRPHD